MSPLDGVNGVRRNLLGRIGLSVGCRVSGARGRSGSAALYALVNLRQPPLHLGLREVPVPRVDGLELTAVDRNARLAEQFKAPAQHHKLTADPADGLAVVLAEIGYCLEVRLQAAGQPHQFDVALALPFQAPVRLYPTEISVDVNLQQCRRMVGRPSCRLWLDATKTKPGQIKLIDKDIDRPDRIVLAQIVV